MGKSSSRWLSGIVIGVLGVLLCLSLSHAATINVPADQPTIQAGIDVATKGDTVVVSPGVYAGPGNRDIRFQGKEVFLVSKSGPSVTTLDCQGSAAEPHRGFVIDGDIDGSLAIEGFTIQNGYTDSSGGAILVEGRPGGTIRKCVFRSNSALISGGAIYSGLSGVALEDCEFIANSADTGGAVANVRSIRGSRFVSNSARSQGSALHLTWPGTIKNCQFVDNHDSPSVINITSGFGHVFDSCLIANNSGVAFKVVNSAVITALDQSTIVGNERVFDLGWDSHVWPKNTIIAFNGDTIAVCVTCPRDCPFSATVDLTRCDVFGHADDFGGCMWSNLNARGNFSADPLFCDTASLDFRLKRGSPCIGAGLGGRDIGAFGVCLATDVIDADEILPSGFKLMQNYPNPFNPSTTITFSIPTRLYSTLKIYNALGQEVTSLVDRQLSAGEHSVSWNGRDDQGKTVATGVYFYSLVAGQNRFTREMILMK